MSAKPNRPLTQLDKSLRPTGQVLLEALADELDSLVARLEALNSEGRHLSKQAIGAHGAAHDVAAVCVNQLKMLQLHLQVQRANIIAGATTEHDTLRTLNSAIEQIGVTRQTLQLAIRRGL